MEKESDVVMEVEGATETADEAGMELERDEEPLVPSHSGLTEKEKKKVRLMQKRALKHRQQQKNLEIAFSQIDILLNTQPAVRPGGADEAMEKLKKMAVLTDAEIPERSKMYRVLDPELFGRFFSQDGLLLSHFSEQSVYGRPANVISAASLTSHLLARSCSLREDHPGSGLLMCVLHLMACTQDSNLADRCWTLLQQFPLEVTAAQLLLLLRNLGVTPEHDTSASHGDFPNLVSCRQGMEGFPYENVENVANFIVLCVEKGTLPLDESCKPVLSLLTKFALDKRLRHSLVLKNIVAAISNLAIKCSDRLGPKRVADWMLCEHDNPYKIFEVCQLVHLSGPLRRSLFVNAAGRILGAAAVSKLAANDSSRIEPRDLREVIRAAMQTNAPLKVFSAMNLLINYIPFVDMTKPDYDLTEKMLSHVHTQLAAKDSADDIRMRGAAAQLRSFLLMSSVEYNKENLPIPLSQ